MEILRDNRSECWSIMTTMTAGDYIDLVRAAHEARGALDGQRNVLTTTSAKRIRARMLNDIRQGAVLPPVVVGLVIDKQLLPDEAQLRTWTQADLLALAQQSRDDVPAAADDTEDELALESDAGNEPDATGPSLAIIDGMQRTAAIIEAAQLDQEILKRELRVEFWMAESVRALVYRMLILNTGQIPWDINRQLSVVFAPLLREIMSNVPGLQKVSTPDHPRRRRGPGQYSSQDLIELYIAFSLRKTGVDTREAVSDEFSRLDFVENVASADFQSQFYDVVGMLVSLDYAFSRHDAIVEDPAARGRQVFDRQPARIGFVVALGISTLGRPGTERLEEERSRRLVEVKEAQATLLERMNQLGTEELQDFMRLGVMKEVLDKRVGQVGRYERSIFLEAFKVLIEENFRVENMEQCWRAG